MSAKEHGLSLASYCTETPTLSTWLRDKGEEEEEKDGEEANRREEPQRSSSDESEESEPEPLPPSAIRRKVSFADAFGLELVSVKEFDNRAQTSLDGLERLLRVEAREEEFYLSSLFAVPSSDEELSLLLRQNKVELESIELLPGSTTIRGVIRVLNLSYHKTVYVRTTLDRWQTHFDLLAEYIPGSSDGQTDRFSFRLTLLPPFRPEGTRVEFCLRYESSVGIFWASNGGTNYVLFCQQKGGKELKEKEGEKEREIEENSYKEKKSCLKVSRKWSSAELKSTGLNADLSEQGSSKPEGSEEERTYNEAGSRSSEAQEACCKALAERRNRRRAARLARVQDYFSQRHTEIQKTQRDLKMSASELISPMARDNPGDPQVLNRQDQDTPPILTHHQIPLLALDWGKNTTPPTLSDTPKIYRGASPDATEKQLTEDEPTEPSTDACEAFLKGIDGSNNHANALNQECLFCTTSLPSHNESNTSTPGVKVLSESPQSPHTGGNTLLRCFRPEETLESYPKERGQDFNPCGAKEEPLAHNYKNKPGITSETHIVLESELVWVQPGSETHDELTPSEDVSLPESNPLEIVAATESRDSKEEHEVSPKECVGNPHCFGTEAEVKGDLDNVVDNTLTFSGIRDMPFTDRQTGSRVSLERLCIEEDKELKQMKEHIREENEMAAEMTMAISWNDCSKDFPVGLESRTLAGNEEPSQLRDDSTEILLTSKGTMPVEEEFDAGTHWPDREVLKLQEVKEVAGHKQEKGLAEPSEAIDKAVDKDIANGEYERSTTTKMEDEEEPYEEDNILHGRKDGGDVCKDFIAHMESATSHTITDIFTHTPALFSRSSEPSGLFGWAESVSEGGSLLFSGSFGETLRHREAQGLQESQDAQSEYPSPLSAPLSRTATLSVNTMSRILLAWWAEFCSLSHIFKALLYTILFLIFITAYLYDLPVCLAIYLLSVCWWCGQGMKKQVATADSVD